MLPIALTMGDPAGIGPEITVKAWEKLRKKKSLSFFSISHPDCFIPFLDASFIKRIDTPEEAVEIFPEKIPLLQVDLKEKPFLGKSNSKNSSAIISSIDIAVNFALEGKIRAVVTSPIHKKTLYEGGFSSPGHTEYLAKISNIKKTVMMLVNGGLRVVPLTIHVPLKDVSSLITKKKITETVEILNHDLKTKFNIAYPKIAVAALNPHAGEEGTIGVEEINIIKPAIDQLREKGVIIDGPYPSDSLFCKERRSEFDAILCMYHDQALIPLKTIDFHKGVNITLGLSFIRTSPDHGTAYDIAGKNIANETSLVEALYLADQLSR